MFWVRHLINIYKMYLINIWVYIGFLGKVISWFEFIYREEPLKLILIKSFPTREILLVAVLKDLY